MDIKEIANKLVTMCREGKNEEIYQELFSDKPVSLEMPGMSKFERCEGIEQIMEKGKWWFGQHEFHGVTCSDPIVADTYFAVRFTMDTTHRESGVRSQSSEIAVYKVKDGKIVQEQFFYDMEMEN